MGTKGIDQRPYDREKFNNNFDAIFGKKKDKKEEVFNNNFDPIFGKKKDKKEEVKDERKKPSINGDSKST